MVRSLFFERQVVCCDLCSEGKIKRVWNYFPNNSVLIQTWHSVLSGVGQGVKYANTQIG